MVDEDTFLACTEVLGARGRRRQPAGEHIISIS